MERIRFHRSAFGYAARDLRIIRLLGIDRHDERCRAGTCEEFGKTARFKSDILEHQCRNPIGGKQLWPVREAEAGTYVAAHVGAAEIVPLGHTNRRVAFICIDKDLQVEPVDVDRRELLQVLREAAVALDEDRAFARVRERSSDRIPSKRALCS